MEYRHSFLYLLLAEVRDFFKPWAEADNQNEFSFQAYGCELRLDIPLGVLYDTLTLTSNISEEECLPFKITVTHNSEHSDQCLPSKVMSYFYASNLKENSILRINSAKPIFDKLQIVKTEMLRNA
jgi:hypothetical protein